MSNMDFIRDENDIEDFEDFKEFYGFDDEEEEPEELDFENLQKADNLQFPEMENED